MRGFMGHWGKGVVKGATRPLSNMVLVLLAKELVRHPDSGFPLLTQRLAVDPTKLVNYQLMTRLLSLDDKEEG
jgi:hypothetical protein